MFMYGYIANLLCFLILVWIHVYIYIYVDCVEVPLGLGGDAIACAFPSRA